MGIIDWILELFFGGKKKVNKKEVATLKRKVTTTKKHIVEAKKAVEFDDSDEALKYLKKFSK